MIYRIPTLFREREKKALEYTGMLINDKCSSKFDSELDNLYLQYNLKITQFGTFLTDKRNILFFFLQDPGYVIFYTR
jgi:hypothetical protein